MSALEALKLANLEWGKALGLAAAHAKISQQVSGVAAEQATIARKALERVGELSAGIGQLKG